MSDDEVSGTNDSDHEGIELGERYADHVTGYAGIATAYCYYLSGHRTVLLERLDNDGKVTEAWFDVGRVSRTDSSPLAPKT